MLLRFAPTPTKTRWRQKATRSAWQNSPSVGRRRGTRNPPERDTRSGSGWRAAARQSYAAPPAERKRGEGEALRQKEDRHAHFAKVYSAQAKSEAFRAAVSNTRIYNYHAVVGREF